MSIDQTTRQTSTEQSADMDAAITAHVDSALTMLRTMTLGVITAVNGERVSAQPLLRSVLVNGKEVALPLIVDAPLEFPRGKNWILTFPVQVNDECIIAFSDRAIDAWDADSRIPFARPQRRRGARHGRK
jgi:5-formyltetrahydrofolate cyclo-ligase